MDWLNLHISVLDSAAFKGSEPVVRATWLCLMRYCVGQENGGRIFNADTWGDRKWQQLCGVTLKEVRQTSELWHWDASDLVVGFYFREKEAEVQRLRGQASAAANARWKRERMPRGNALDDASRMPSGMPHGNAEENRREEKGRGAHTCAHATTTTPSNSQGKIETAAILAACGLPCSKTDVREWAGGLARVACCKSEDEAKSFIRWAIKVCADQGVEVEHWRHVRRLAIEWNQSEREKNWIAL